MRKVVALIYGCHFWNALISTKAAIYKNELKTMFAVNTDTLYKLHTLREKRNTVSCVCIGRTQQQQQQMKSKLDTMNFAYTYDVHRIGHCFWALDAVAKYVITVQQMYSASLRIVSFGIRSLACRFNALVHSSDNHFGI